MCVREENLKVPCGQAWLATNCSGLLVMAAVGLSVTNVGLEKTPVFLGCKIN